MVIRDLIAECCEHWWGYCFMIELGSRQKIRGEIDSIDTVLLREGFDQPLCRSSHGAADVHNSARVLKCGGKCGLIVLNVLLNGWCGVASHPRFGGGDICARPVVCRYWDSRSDDFQCCLPAKVTFLVGVKSLRIIRRVHNWWLDHFNRML